MSSVMSQPKLTKYVPRLENGDRLTRDEFETLYRQTSEKTKAELIDGVVYMASPVRVVLHAVQDGDMQTWLGFYKLHTSGIKQAVNGTLRLRGNNVVQPDSMIYLPPLLGGQSTIDLEGFLAGAPELVVEISNSSKSLDLGDKKRAYQKHGIPEYLVWRVQDDAIDWFQLVNGQYELLPADGQGVVRSIIFPGLWLNVAAMLASDLPTVIATLQAGCATPEHQAFATKISNMK